MARGVLLGLAAGIALGTVLTLSRSLFGGRPLPFWLENTAGVWFVTAFVAGALVRRAAAGALAGLLALLLALALHDSVWFVTDPGFSVQVTPVLRPGWALVSGAVGLAAGGLGGWSAPRPDRWWLAVGLVGGLVAGEAAALFAGGVPHPAFDPVMGTAQAVVALAGVLLAVGEPSRWRTLLLTLLVGGGIVAVELVTGLVTRLVWG